MGVMEEGMAEAEIEAEAEAEADRERVPARTALRRNMNPPGTREKDGVGSDCAVRRWVKYELTRSAMEVNCCQGWCWWCGCRSVGRGGPGAKTD